MGRELVRLDQDAFDVHVFALRRKLEEPGGKAPRITTVRGRGYRMEA